MADPKYAAVLLNNRAQCFIMLCREIHAEDSEIGQEARKCAMRANMDAARAIELALNLDFRSYNILVTNLGYM